MSGKNVADHVIDRLLEWNVEHVFGYPGDGINGLLAAWESHDDPPAFIQSRHEEMSALEATGYAKARGKPGVCLATSGPGAVHLLNGLYDAKLDHVPVVAIVGQTDRTAMGGAYQQEIDLLSLYKDVASDYVQMVTVPEQLPNALDRAMRIAIGNRTTTAIIVPADVQELEYSPPRHEFKMVPSSTGLSLPSMTASTDALDTAAEVLNSGTKVAILVGSGARGAHAEIEQVADLLAAGAAKALLGIDVLDDDKPWVTGAIGLLGTRPSYELMRDCDTLLMVGTSFPYTQFMPPLDQARAVEIDIDPRFIGMRYPTEANIVADARQALAALIPRLERKQDRDWRATIESNVARWQDTMDRQAHVESHPVNPQRVFSELNQHMPEDAIITADSGTTANWYARQLRFRTTMRGSLSGTLATMGCAVPYAIGAKFAHPERPAIAFEGDGAMQMNGMAELITIRRYWHQWADPRLIVVVLHNNDLNQVTWEMRAMSGSPKFTESQSLPDVDYAAFAASIGLHAITITDPNDLSGAWHEALTSERPTVLDVHTDPNMPPIPPHGTWEQFTALASSFIHGDEDRIGYTVQGLKTKAQELFPRRRG